jgi:N-acetylmuramoyl-L-alanine amidase
VSDSRRTRRVAWLLGLCLLAAALGWGLSRHDAKHPRAALAAARDQASVAAPAPTATATTPTATTTPPGARPLPLSGRVITVDPGHNGGNFTHSSEIARPVPDGNGTKECDTTGTAAPDGYRETDFNWSVARRLRVLLSAAGATVVMTRSSNTGVGPCVNERAAIGNRARSDVAISIHADGGPTDGSGFAVLIPAALPSGGDRAILAPSRRLGIDLRGALIGIGLHTSTYDGNDGLAPRTDLGGLNLSRVPKVFVEVANMQNHADEAPMETSGYRQRVALALLAGIERFLPAG